MPNTKQRIIYVQGGVIQWGHRDEWQQKTRLLGTASLGYLGMEILR